MKTPSKKAENLKKIKFYKYHGTGNDFILIDNREQQVVFNTPDEVSSLCNRRLGIGADGLIILEESSKYDFRMIYYNSDGKEGSMCGNGGRCIVAFAAYLGIIGRTTVFEAIDGLHKAEILEGDNNHAEIALKMQDVTEFEKNDNDYILDTGSPHYVILADDVSLLNVVEEGRKIRYNTRFREQGINVNFVCNKDGKSVILTYERGVEDETWSCGTGSVAAAIALELEGKTIPGQPVEIFTRGGKLKISFTRDGDKFSNIYLTGPTACVFNGQFEK